MTVFGTRPDTIKMAPVVEALEAAGPEVESIVCVSAQHRQMLDDLLGLFDIEPDYDLDIMEQGQTLTQVTTKVLIGMERVLRQARPDVVLVHGDTSTSSAAALAAFYQQIPVGHVEAGLRTNNRYEPFPEEINRRINGVVCSYHFAPTSRSAANLLGEGTDPDDVIVTGNTVIDAFLATAARTDVSAPQLAALDADRPLLFVEAHRRENHGAMREIAFAMRDIAALPARPQILWPLHPSPQVAPVVREVLEGVEGIHLTTPMNYGELVCAVRASRFLLTDSGGLQEEAPCLGKPVLVLRRTTERPEGLAAGTLELVGTDRATIVASAERLLSDDDAYLAMARASNPYGDGRASERIVRWLLARMRGGVYPDAFVAAA
ncbi:MAG TPA: UDP-N-acetylglucosamine 2-epimerase (non-hydrolyzing) [Candidatus Dormibacteraeota bacterium]|nr:UDP-N-acetylglucosamine 2-epimerase (non-hydrolyzing) [Candidatus Dormibacteraeota bacterium]